METVGTGAGQLKLFIQIGSAWEITFAFRTYDSTTETHTNDDISGNTFSFSLWKYKGARSKIFNYTNQSGITVPIYSTHEILVRGLAADTVSQEEGDYYFELRRTDLNKAKVFGIAVLSFDAKT
jgi:hypothetical protein